MTWTVADRLGVAETIELGERVTDVLVSWPRRHGRECGRLKDGRADAYTCERGTIGCHFAPGWGREVQAKLQAWSMAEELDIARSGYMWRVRVTESDWDMGMLNSWVDGEVGPARDAYAALDLVRADLIAEGTDPDSIEDDGTDPPALRVSYPCEGCEDWSDAADEYLRYHEGDDPHGTDLIYTVEPAWS